MPTEEGSDGGGGAGAGAGEKKSSQAPAKPGACGAAKFLAGLPSRGNFSSGSAPSNLVRTLTLEAPQWLLSSRALWGASICAAKCVLSPFFLLWSAQGGFRVYVCEHSTDPPGQWSSVTILSRINEISPYISHFSLFASSFYYFMNLIVLLVLMFFCAQIHEMFLL